MRKTITLLAIKLSLFILCINHSFLHAQQSRNRIAQIEIGNFSTGSKLSVKKAGDGTYGIYVDNAGLSSLFQPQPVQFELYKDSTNIITTKTGYQTITKQGAGFTGRGIVKSAQASFEVADKWEVKDEVLHLSRTVKVHGNSTGGFSSAIKFISKQKQARNEVNYFAPGMIYGSTDYITDVAIGGSKGGLITWIREDRLPAPLFGILYKDGTSVSILHPNPQGSTTKEDGHDLQVKTLIDERFLFGALGAEETEGNLKLGFVWPGTEGETTYRGYTYPGGQMHKWRRRYHPVKNGFVQEYKVDFKFLKDNKDFADYYKNAWRWAWQTLSPQVNKQDIELARKSLVDMLAERVETSDGYSGIPNSAMAIAMDTPTSDRKTVMGFTGKALEAANFLLQNADRIKTADSDKQRQLGINIINTYTKLNLSPPEGEGFDMQTWKPQMAIPRFKRVFLRSFGDDLKSLLKTVKREKQQGRNHADWLTWAKTFGDWLLPQQTAEGGFPRAWEPVTGKVADASPKSSYCAIPYLLLLTELTGDDKYKQAAISAGEFCWSNGQYKGLFVGGTIDNPDVIDKEAGTLSLEAHLALYDATKNKKWLDRAKVAANYAETWMYIWNVPMPDDESDDDLHWKKGVSTVGLQLISTGHSLVDAYMAFDVDEYAKLSVLSNDKHYLDVATILLHNTKGMLALPGRTYGLRGAGWQQEHWSLAPERGYGRKKFWLPWVSTSHLNGIFGLEEYNKKLFDQLKNVKK